MSTLFSAEYWLLWALVLGLALFFPVRNLIWVLYVRRAQSKLGTSLDDTERHRLKRRASFTSCLICFLFALFYSNYLFRGDT